jgi:hypothetical protein
MENIKLLFEGEEFEMGLVPKTFAGMKKKVNSLICVPENRLFLVVNEFGSKAPVNSNKTYLRAISVAKCRAIEVVNVSSSQESVEIEDVVRRGRKKKREMSKAESEEEMDIAEGEMCAICYRKFKEPMAANCGHVCCLECWKKILANFLECPMCKARVRLCHLQPVINKTES